jgi:hypothetical protein
VFGPRFQGWFHGSLLSPGFMPGFKGHETKGWFHAL